MHKLKIFVIGTRGFPDIQGGVEKHCEELYPRLISLSCDVTVFARTPYIPKQKRLKEWKRINFIHLWCPKRKSLEAIIHTFLGILIARIKSPDILHIHAIGPSLLTPLARLMGLKVVITNHGPDYDRQKWGRAAKFMLRLGEKMGGLYANEVIVISSVIANIIRERCHRESNLINNGVTLPEKSKQTDLLTQIGVQPNNYILAVARFVPEKGLHDLIKAFKDMNSDYKLVIAGDADHETAYSRNLRRMAAEADKIILTGYITGEPLNQIFSYARLFVLPSYHEGLPISLLEALSYGLPVLVSDISANKEVGLPVERYFRCGNVEDLKKKMEMLLEKELSSEADREEMRKHIEEKYNWEKIAKQTIEVYRKALSAQAHSAERPS